jgi:RNA polymerase sigma-70 factor (ECF subfamily)
MARLRDLLIRRELDRDERTLPDEPLAQDHVIELRDRRIFGELFDRYVDRVHGFCLRRCGDWEVAQDLTSSTFLEAWRHRDRVVLTEATALPWLLGVAFNLSRNASRSQRRFQAAVARLPRDDVSADHADAVAERLDDQRRVREALEAVGRLSDDERAVIALVALGDLTYEEAALALRVPVGTVRSRLFRARRRLARVSGESGLPEAAP